MIGQRQIGRDLRCTGGGGLARHKWRYVSGAANSMAGFDSRITTTVGCRDQGVPGRVSRLAIDRVVQPRRGAKVFRPLTLIIKVNPLRLRIKVNVLGLGSTIADQRRLLLTC